VKIRRGRLRSTIKWGGAALTVLLLIVWVGSIRYSAWVSIQPIGQVSVIPGCLFVVYTRDWTIVSRTIEGRVSPRRPETPHFWWFHFLTGGQAIKAITIPIWVLLVAVTLPTLYIWFRNRKHPSGTCPECGYSRTGLPADRACPECGCAASTNG
jgi:hypothetical protein